ncbi:MAG: chemotaxis protein CheW [Bacteroidales bacterium]|nr:chemotaxis protein CheW [Bacteroidales bacterium]MBN2756031.1 chemotaxis protein CheW [Bacteroidales bacterium]
MNKKNKKTKINSYLVFCLDTELFAIHVDKILSILEMKKITKIPESPEYMKGVINLRGEVLPIIDSHLKFSLPPIDITMKTSIIVLEIETAENKIKLGLMVDKVEEVIQIVKKEILPPPNIGTAFESKFINGMYKKDDKTFIMIIDIDKVLSIKEIIDLGDLKINEIIESEKTKKEEKTEEFIENEKTKKGDKLKKQKKEEKIKKDTELNKTDSE